MLINNLTKSDWMFERIILVCFMTFVFFIPPMWGQKMTNWDLPFNKCWDISVNSGIIGNIASDNKLFIIFSTTDSLLTSVNYKNGVEFWKSEFGSNLISQILSDNNSIIFISNLRHKQINDKLILRSVNPYTGITNWKNEFTYTTNLKIITSTENVIILSNNEEISSFDKTNGKQIWNREFKDQVLSYKSINSDEFIILTKEDLFRISTKNGEILSSQKFASQELNNFTLNQNILIWSNKTGEIYSYSLENKSTLWKLKTGGKISNLVITEQGILATSHDNFIYLFSSKTGKIKWKKRVAGRISISPLIFKSYGVFINTDDNFALILNIVNGRVINKISIESNDTFSGSPLLVQNMLIFQTNKGVSAFSNSGC